MKIGRVHEEWIIEEWIIPSPEPGNSSQNSRHDGSLRVISNFPLGGHVQPGKAPDAQVVTYCLHGSQPQVLGGNVCTPYYEVFK